MSSCLDCQSVCLSLASIYLLICPITIFLCIHPPICLCTCLLSPLRASEPWPKAAGPRSAWCCWGWGWPWPLSCLPWSSPAATPAAAPRPLPTLRLLLTPRSARTLDEPSSSSMAHLWMLPLRLWSALESSTLRAWAWAEGLSSPSTMQPRGRWKSSMPGRQCPPTTSRVCWTSVSRPSHWAQGPSGSECRANSVAMPRPTAAMAACPGHNCSSPPSPCSEGTTTCPPSSVSSCRVTSYGLPCPRRPSEPLRAQDPFPWPALAATLETVATEGAEAFYTGTLGQMLLEDIADQGSGLTPQDLASFQAEVVEALEMPLGDYTLYSPPPPAGGAILSLILNVLQGFNFSSESVARSEGSVNLYHHLVETLKFAGGQRWRLWDPRSHLDIQNVSQDLLGEALAQHIRRQIDARGDHQPSHYSLAGAWGHKMGTSHVSVLGEDGSAVAATSTINTPFGAMLYSPRTGILLNNELLDLCWRRPPGSKVTPQPVPGERPPSSMVPSILVNTAQGSKLVIGGAGGELIISAVAQAIINKLWLGFDLSTAIAAPILHVTSKGHVEYEPRFSQEVQKGLQARGHNQTKSPFFLNVVQAVSQDGACVYAAADPRKGGEASGY
ncbi:glutathione hydrolase 5 proenzyme isoform X1 [Ursus maritimus]|uniref:Glutathione hydrolase 5 proenzyme n=1 Tax=Ursus maritimus TaxID=29073 RepID=A0A8M1EXD5_URSMA|nr:glutathione hydrolase 5 proenzyme isoform X1 [Ursus maritimus]